MIRNHSSFMALLMTLVACAAKPPETNTPASGPPSASHDAAAAELIAQVERALQAWRDSCPAANEQGLCVELAPAEASPQRCGAPVIGRVVVHPRDPELAASAQAELAAAMDRAGCQGAEDREGCEREVLAVQPRDPALKRRFEGALAAARLARADAELEAYFAITMPTDIDFFVEEWKRDSPEPGHAEQYRAQLARKQDSEQRFKTYFDAKSELGTTLTEDLAMIKAYHDEEALMRAALRTSWIALHFYDELHTAEVPPTLRPEAARDAYCQALDDFGALARDKAKEAAYYCTARAAQDGFSSPTVQTCHELLTQLEQLP